MKVMCIGLDKPKQNHPDLIKAASEMYIGKTCNVVYQEQDLYEFAEFPHPFQILWDKKNFIPLSNIDETEFIREQIKTTA